MDLEFLKQNNLGTNVLISVAVVLVIYYAGEALGDKFPLKGMIDGITNSIPDMGGFPKVALLGVVCVVIITVLLGMRPDDNKSVLEEGFEGQAAGPIAEEEEAPETDVVDIQKEDAVKNANTPVESNEVYSSIEGQINTENKFPKDCFPKDQLQPQELLPGDYESSWKEVAPNNPGALEDQNLLEAGYHVGVNTVGQSLRNANLQLRSEPANPQVKVSPWMQSTIDADANRKPLEIGSQ